MFPQYNPQKPVAKVVFIGNRGSGKSSLIRSTLGRSFVDTYEPTREPVFTSLQCQDVTLQMWDGYTSDAAPQFKRDYLKNCDLVVICCSLYHNPTNLKEEFAASIQEIKEFFPNLPQNLPILLVATHGEFNQDSDDEEDNLEEYPYLAVSAESGANVQVLVGQMATSAAEYISAKQKAHLQRHTINVRQHSTRIMHEIIHFLNQYQGPKKPEADSLAILCQDIRAHWRSLKEYQRQTIVHYLLNPQEHQFAFNQVCKNVGHNTALGKKLLALGALVAAVGGVLALTGVLASLAVVTGGIAVPILLAAGIPTLLASAGLFKCRNRKVEPDLKTLQTVHHSALNFGLRCGEG